MIRAGGLDAVDPRHLQVHQTTSGRVAQHGRHRLGPVGGRARRPRCRRRRASSRASPARTTAWSSTSTTRIMRVGSSRSPRRSPVPGAVPGDDRNVRVPPGVARPATPARAGPRLLGRVRPVGVEADAVVGDLEHEPARVSRRTVHGEVPAPRVPQRVADRLLGDPPDQTATSRRRTRSRLRRRRPWPRARPPRPARPGRRERPRQAVGREVRAGGSRPAASAATAQAVRSEVAARASVSGRGGVAVPGWQAESAKAVPARSCTTPSCRSRAMRRRSASEASTAAWSSRSRSSAAGAAAGSAPRCMAGRRRTRTSERSRA